MLKLSIGYVSYCTKLPLPKKGLRAPRQMRRMRKSSQRKRRVALLRQINKLSDSESQNKRRKIQVYFWNIVGDVEHISVPKLEAAVRKEFNSCDDRLIQAQIRLMQSEARVRIQRTNKVWIRQPDFDEKRQP